MHTHIHTYSIDSPRRGDTLGDTPNNNNHNTNINDDNDDHNDTNTHNTNNDNTPTVPKGDTWGEYSFNQK